MTHDFTIYYDKDSKESRSCLTKLYAMSFGKRTVACYKSTLIYHNYGCNCGRCATIGLKQTRVDTDPKEEPVQLCIFRSTKKSHNIIIYYS